MLTRRRAVQTILGAGAVPAVLRGARRKPGDKPNLLFLWTDEQRFDTLAVNGNHTYRVPELNRLAAGSVSFTRCYDTQPVCTPARCSVMTGLYPHTTGLTSNNIPLPADVKAMPELLADASYRTAYMGKWHLGDELFAQHGFETWVSMEDGYNQHFTPGRDRNAVSDYHRFLLAHGYKPGDGGRFSRAFAVTRPPEHTKPAFLAAEASKFIFSKRAEPWMLYVNFLEPHMPFTGPYNDLHSEDEAPLPRNYPGVPIEREPESYQRSRERYLEKGFEGHDLKTRAGWQRLNRNYAGLCTLVDQAVGRILWALEASGQADNTIIVFTSDHGDMMGSHTLLAKGVLYEEAVRIPMLLRAPFRGIRRGRIEQPISQIDLVPTLLELMGKKPDGPLQGQSLLPLLHGGRLREEHVYVQWPNPRSQAVISPEGWKLAAFESGNSLLFNLAEDPLEMRNLYYRGEAAAELRKLHARLEEWRKRVKL